MYRADGYISEQPRLERCFPRVCVGIGRPANIAISLGMCPPGSDTTGRTAHLRNSREARAPGGWTHRRNRTDSKNPCHGVRPPVTGRTGQPTYIAVNQAMRPPGAWEAPANQIAGIPKRFLCCPLMIEMRRLCAPVHRKSTRASDSGVGSPSSTDFIILNRP
jgi:hypothetical protein